MIADEPSRWIIQIIYDNNNNQIIGSHFNNKGTESIVSLATDYTTNKAVVIYESYVMLIFMNDSDTAIIIMIHR